MKKRTILVAKTKALIRCEVTAQLICAKFSHRHKKVQVGKDQEKAQSEKDSNSKNRGGKKNKLIIRYLYYENIS